MFSLTLTAGLTVVILAFFAEYIDSSLGMGYGTTLTPILIIMGYEPLQVVPAILLSELITGLLAGFTHHTMGNVNLKPKTISLRRIFLKIRQLGFRESYRRGVPLHLRITIVIALCSIVGTIASVFLALSLPKFYLKLYIGMLVLAIGIVILVTLHRTYAFSWKKIVGLGLLASFNKGISGGGYGPVVTGGQLLAGLEGKNAVGITSLAEGLTCIVGVVTYILSRGHVEWKLAPYLAIGAVISVPFSVYTVKSIRTDSLRMLIGIITAGLGAFTLYKIFAG